MVQYKQKSLILSVIADKAIDAEKRQNIVTKKN